MLRIKTIIYKWIYQKEKTCISSKKCDISEPIDFTPEVEPYRQELYFGRYNLSQCVVAESTWTKHCTMKSST